MEKLINHPPDQLTILFPLSEAVDIYNLKSKCEQLGVNTDAKNNRPITYHFSTKDSQEPEVATEKMVKNWVNAQGTATVFSSIEAYENWEQLLYSDDETNFLLALSILNTAKRPEGKFFALLLAVAINHGKPELKENAAQILSPYLTIQELNDYSNTYFPNLVDLKFYQVETKIKSFININYYQFWTNTLLKRAQFFTKNIVALSSRNVQEIIKHPNFLKWTKGNIESFKFRIEKGDDLTGLYYLGDNFTIPKSIEISAEIPYTLKPNEIPYLDCETLILKNIDLPISIKECLPLERIKRVIWDYPADIYFLDHIFPNVTDINLAGNKVQTIALNQIKKQIKYANLTLRTQSEVPSIIYDCTELNSLHIKGRKIKAFSSAIAKLQNLTNLILEGIILEEFPTDIFRIPNVAFMCGITISKEVIDFRKNCQYYGPKRIFFRSNKVKLFPYGLAPLKGLIELRFTETDIKVLDKRILNFKYLECLCIEYHKLTIIPDFLQLLENIEILYFYTGKITAISFDWINHINQKGIILTLSKNPINSLPSIPDTFDIEQVIKNNGRVRFSEEQLPLEQIEQYKAIFGEKFIEFFN